MSLWKTKTDWFSITLDDEPPIYGNIEILPEGSELDYQRVEMRYSPHDEEMVWTAIFLWEGMEVVYWFLTPDHWESFPEKIVQLTP